MFEREILTELLQADDYLSVYNHPRLQLIRTIKAKNWITRAAWMLFQKRVKKFRRAMGNF